MQILKDEIKKKILVEASNIFVEKGYDRTTVREIAEKVGISVGNIYRYFSNKEKILEELISEFETQLKSFSDDLDPNVFKDDTQKMCDDFINGLIKLFQRNYIAINVLFQNIANERFGEFKIVIIQSMTDKIMIVSNALKTDKINERVAKAVSSASVEGIRTIISSRTKFDKKVEEDLRVYLSLILRDLLFRMKEV